MLKKCFLKWFTILQKIYQRSSSDLGLESLDEVPASGPLVSFTSLSTDDDDDGKGVFSDSVMSRGC